MPRWKLLALRAAHVFVCLLAAGCARKARFNDTDAQIPAPAPETHPIASPIAIENAQPGTADWALRNPARRHEVEGYASVTSAQSGDRVAVRVNVDHAMAVRWELYRMGYYQGLGARLMSSGEPSTVAPQPLCAADATTGLVECDWSDAFELDVDASWVTGQYFVKLIAEDGHDSFVSLVVRETDRRAPVLFQSSVLTWQAYNFYGSASLYRNELPAELGFRAKHADVVSFDRPYTCQDPEDTQCLPGAGDFELGERWMASWLEQHGVDVAYVTNIDVDTDPSLPRRRKLFMTVGHDEYWPVAERDTLEAARAAGVSLGFFSANTGYWRVRLEASKRGVPRRSVVCYKDAARDPIQEAADTTVQFRSEPMSRPESLLLGVMYDNNASRTYYDGLAQVVHDAKHWIYAGTGVRDGDLLAHVVGYEWDHAFGLLSDPPGLEIVAHAELMNVFGTPLASDVTLYYPTHSSLVFAAGSIRWAQGLARPEYTDPRIQRMTFNVLKRAGVEITDPGPTIDPLPGPPTPPLAAWAGTGKAGEADGKRERAEFDAPAGIATGPHGELYVTDARRHAIRVISAAGQVSTLAGCGTDQFHDGQGLDACFNQPTGIVHAPDGTLYVADTLNDRVRAVSPDGQVTTFAGTGKAGSSDGPDRLKATFSDPRAVALAPDGTLYVGESGSGRVRKIDVHGAVSTVTSLGQPTGIVVAPDGTLYIVDIRNATIMQMREGTVTTLAGGYGEYGDRDGIGPDARLRPGEGLALDGGRLVFTDAANHKLRAIELSNARVMTLAGSDETTRELELPRGVVATPDGFIVSDSGHHRLVLVPR